MKKDFGVYTITRNEPVFLRLWCNYYCNVFGDENVYILDNSSIDNSVNEARERHPSINVINVPSTHAFDHSWLRDTVEGMQRKLLLTHSVVLFAETDEFLIPHESMGDLRQYCERFLASDDKRVRTMGWGIVHQINTEPKIELSDGVDVLKHRNSMWRLPSYCKTLLVKEPQIYGKGFHNTFQTREGIPESTPIDRMLDLLHAWHIDIDLYHERCLSRVDLKKAGTPHGSTDRRQVKELFLTNKEPWNPDINLYVKSKQNVPDWWCGKLIY